MLKSVYVRTIYRTRRDARHPDRKVNFAFRCAPESRCFPPQRFQANKTSSEAYIVLCPGSGTACSGRSALETADTSASSRQDRHRHRLRRSTEKQDGSDGASGFPGYWLSSPCARCEVLVFFVSHWVHPIQPDPDPMIVISLTYFTR